MPAVKRVLLVNDDAILRASLADAVRAQGLEPVEASSCDEGLARYAEGDYEFAVVDAGDGRALCQALRAQGACLPILALADAADIKVEGADEIIVKPFRLSLLIVRANAHAVVRAHGAETGTRIGPYLFRPNAKVLIEGARRIRLTEKETNILRFLKRAGRTVSRETLLHEVWGYNLAVTTHTLETHIYRLRRKIEQDPADARILLTEDGGYRLAC